MVEHFAKNWYRKWIRSRVQNELYLQRIKLVWFIWGYLPILRTQAFSLVNRIKLIIEFLGVDWNVLHAHRPCEIAEITKNIAERPSNPGEIFVEAGCWKGGSSAKFSLICEMLGYYLYIYDSFRGVEPLSEEERGGGYDYSGEYAATEEEVVENIKKYGVYKVCRIHKGWYSDTIATDPPNKPIRLVFIDCDLAKGTKEVLQGVVPNLVGDGCIFTQDYHIKPVRNLVHDPITWKNLQIGFPSIYQKCGNLALIQFTSK